jgi:hypothetical protein
VLLKTDATLLEAAITRLSTIHPYETPAIWAGAAMPPPRRPPLGWVLWRAEYPLSARLTLQRYYFTSTKNARKP